MAKHDEVAIEYVWLATFYEVDLKTGQMQATETVEVENLTDLEIHLMLASASRPATVQHVLRDPQSRQINQLPTGLQLIGGNGDNVLPETSEGYIPGAFVA